MKRLIGWGLPLLLLAGLALWFVHGRTASTDAAPAARVAASTETGASPAAGVQDAAAVLRKRLSELPPQSPAQRAAMDRIRAETMKNQDQRRWLAPFDQIYTEFRAKAEKGDAAAAYVLGRRSAACLDTLNEKAPAQLLAALDRDVQGWASGPQSQSRLASTRQRYESEFAEYEACASIDRASLDEALIWLERAGRGEAEGAKLAYVRTWAKQAGGDRNALIADIERIAAQRAQAREWLEQGRAAGDDEALDLYIEAYSGGNGLYPRDPVQEQAYHFVRDLVIGRRTSEFDARWANGPDRYRGNLTPQQWSEAEAQGRSIFKDYYEAKPVWRNGVPPALPPLPGSKQADSGGRSG